MKSPARAILIDRDGTINEDVGFITQLSQLRLYNFAGESIKLINEAGRHAIVITNQSGIARGLFNEDFLLRLHGRIESLLSRDGARIDAFYFCPHHPEFGEPPYRQDCDCRKPKAGMIRQAARDFNLELKECYVIGDRYRDVEMAHTAGAHSLMVMTGYGRAEYMSEHDSWPQQPEHVAENLLEAVKWILRES
ncbi:MAG: HAD family hydrolase [Acidobacteria bacterium]|nr:HAD family hydrolase [Acidobacteriota bacterium]